MGNLLSWNSFSSSSSGGHSTSIVPRTMTPEPTAPEPMIPEPTTPESVMPVRVRQVLMPTLEKLYEDESQSKPFRQPVDSQKFPDYLDIIKKPMDLSIIGKKLEAGEYEDEFEYCHDVDLIFENAKNYYKKHEDPSDPLYQEVLLIYNYSLALLEVFNKEIRPVMETLGWKYEITEREYRRHE